jgi:hypothetical protein
VREEEEEEARRREDPEEEEGKVGLNVNRLPWFQFKFR